jgi:tartrate-resistant acid phosphatase type 5
LHPAACGFLKLVKSKFMKIIFLVIVTLLFPKLSQSALPQSGHFFVIGDYGAASAAQEKIKDMIDKTKPSFIITVGDNCYPDCSNLSRLKERVGAYYKQYIRSKHLKQSSQTNRFFPTLGNHDWNNTKTAQPYRDFFELPGNERFYDFRVGPIHLFTLDSDKREPSGNRKDSAQARWLAEKSQASNAKFKIAYFHHAPYSSGHHGSNLDMQWTLREWVLTLS